MLTHTFLLVAALWSTSFNSTSFGHNSATVLSPLGGPPRIHLADRSGGDITSTEWAAIKSVGLHGCVTDARITALTLCIKDCKDRATTASGSDGTITAVMRKMISDLPAGTSFTVKVTVKDAKGKLWEVPDARFVWKG